RLNAATRDSLNRRPDAKPVHSGLRKQDGEVHTTKGEPMTRLSIRGALLAFVIVAGLVAAVPTEAGPPGNNYTVTPPVSNMPGVAPTTDAHLPNPWGLPRRATGPRWLADH